MKDLKWGMTASDNYTLTVDELKELDEGYKEWIKLLNQAIENGDYDLIEEISEMGK